MKVKIQGYGGKNHSWSVVNQNIARAMSLAGHEVHFISTNGLEYFPDDLRSLLRLQPEGRYDCQISYTAPLNWPHYLSSGDKNRFGIWTYEWKNLPAIFPKFYTSCDKILAPSHFAKECFVHSKVPADRVEVIPHGINLLAFENKEKYQLKTNKKNKILVNIGQPHLRKNIKGMLEGFGRAFTNTDDVCLVAKIAAKKPTAQFEVDAIKILNDFKKKYPKHAEIELITDFVPDIVTLYNACDVVYTASYCEGFYLPGIEALAAGKINVAPRYGGQLDFLNDGNSLLVDGKIIRADLKMQYWSANLYNEVFDSNADDAAKKLQGAIFDKGIQSSLNRNVPLEYSWNSVIKQIENLCH